jgi:hypothetical protein
MSVFIGFFHGRQACLGRANHVPFAALRIRLAVSGAHGGQDEYEVRRSGPDDYSIDETRRRFFSTLAPGIA